MVPKLAVTGGDGVLGGVWMRLWIWWAGDFRSFCKDTERCYQFVVVHIA